MRPADAFRALSLTSCFSLLAFAQSRWNWFPVNTNETSGFKFYFENPPAPEATITISGARAGVPFTVTKTIGTDNIHGDYGFFAFDIVNLDRLEVKSIRIVMGDLRQTITNPRTGVYYVF